MICVYTHTHTHNHYSDWWSPAVAVDLPELHQAASLKIVLVVRNVHQFRMMEALMQQKECLVSPRSVPQSCLWFLEVVPLTPLLVDFSDMHRLTPINHTWYYGNCWTCSWIHLLTVSCNSIFYLPAEQYTSQESGGAGLCCVIVSVVSRVIVQIDHFWFRKPSKRSLNNSRYLFQLKQT